VHATSHEAQTLQIDQLPYPGPKMIDHFRFVSLMFILWIIDVVVLTYALDAVMQDGVTIVVLFVNEVRSNKWRVANNLRFSFSMLSCAWRLFTPH
jgi:hypothetical protein